MSSPIRLAHNHDTSFKVLAKTINDDLKSIYSHNHPELKLCGLENGVGDMDIVSISTTGIAQDLEELITKINHDKDDNLLPQVIMSISNTINPSQLGKSIKKFQMQQSVKFENINDSTDTVSLAGQFFTYESPIQIVILARSGFAVMELGLAILNILSNNHTIQYDMAIRDKANPDNLFLLKKFGSLKLANVDTASFSESTERHSGVVATATEFNIRNTYFIFRDHDDVMTKYAVENNHGMSLSVDGVSGVVSTEG